MAKIKGPLAHEIINVNDYLCLFFEAYFMSK